VEVLQTDQHLCLWEARNAPPMQGKGWRLLARAAHRVKVGSWVAFGAEVDRGTGEIVALLGGKAVLRARSALIKPTGTARLTIRATGNREQWRWLEVREKP
jgi:hypothetical protein